MNDSQLLRSTIKDFKLFRQCREETIGEFILHARMVPLEKGQVLFIHEEEAARFFVVMKGWVKLYREILDGTQAVIDILTRGHMFGETCIFQDDIYPYTAEATEPSLLISFPLSLLKLEIQENSKFAMEMMGSMTRYRKQQEQEIEHRTVQNASQRIGCFLLRLVDQQRDGPITIQLPYDKTLLASRLGMQPETFSRALGKLKAATGITVKGAVIEMDSVEQLSEYSCIACSSEFPCQDLKALKE